MDFSAEFVEWSYGCMVLARSCFRSSARIVNRALSSDQTGIHVTEKRAESKNRFGSDHYPVVMDFELENLFPSQPER